MQNRQSFPSLLLLLALGLYRPLSADEVAVPHAPEICDLVVIRDSKSNTAIINWSGGTPPFSIVRGDAPRFDQAGEIKHLADGISIRRYVDSGALKSGRRYWYQVYDDNSAPEVYSVTSGEPTERDRSGHPGDDLPPDNNYCRGVLRHPATWKSR